MLAKPNELQWQGDPGHYEVYYLTLTDPATGVGLWIRYTMVAPLPGTGADATCALWLLAMDPRAGRSPTFARKATLPIDQLAGRQTPFELRIDGAVLTDFGMSGGFDDVAWDLRWTPRSGSYEHVHPLLRRAGVAQSVLVLPHADLSIDGTVTLPGERSGSRRRAVARLTSGVRSTLGAGPGSTATTSIPSRVIRCRGAFVDAVSVFVARFGREVGPNTPVVGRIAGEDFNSTSPVRVLANGSTFALTGWRFEAIDGRAEADRRGRR